MKAGFALRFAAREYRSSRRRLGLYMSSIAIGVGALVAINSFSADVTHSVRSQSRSLLGADLEISSNHPFNDSIQGLLDSLRATGHRISREVSFGSMGLIVRNGATRLMSVRAVTGEYPYYGAITTAPENIWYSFRKTRSAIVDPAVLIQLDAVPGDTIAIGEERFEIAGTVTNVPGDISLRAALGPRVFIPGEYLPATGLLRFGSRARYKVYLDFRGDGDLKNFIDHYWDYLKRQGTSYATVRDRERNLTDALTNFTRFLGLIGLAALLLGGIGVASAVSVFVKEKVPVVAVLRCLGATQPTVFLAFVIQAVAMGFLGSLAGVLLGLLVQSQLPHVLGALLPGDVTTRLHPIPILAGLGMGVWVSSIFALMPLLSIRDVTPLSALRRDYENGVKRRTIFRDLRRVLAYLALALSVLWLSGWQAPTREIGLAFAAAIGFTTLMLWLTAWLLTRSTRRFFPSNARYVMRQGIANLFRPHNQTTAVVLALGFGAFLIATIYIVQRNLLDRFSLDGGESRPNLVMFDIQQDQRTDVLEQIDRLDMPVLSVAPIITSTIRAINGNTPEDLLADSAGAGPPRWALRRQYRNTYRERMTRSETLIEGEWWGAADDASGGNRLPRVSIERDLADELHVGLGDTITWNVQGVALDTRIASIRKVDWARFDTNFFFVFEPGVLEDAPQQFVIFTRSTDPYKRAILQRNVVRAHPNIAAVDLAIVQDALDSIISKVTAAIRFMAFFSLSGGLFVLLGAIGTSRFQRTRECVLLKTMGARSRQIRQILLTEYFALGALAGLTGVALSTAAGWMLVRFLFETEFSLPFPALALLWSGVVVLTVTTGLAHSRPVIRKKPLAVIRELAE